MLDAFWRAVAYCLHPKVMLLSLLPLVLAAALTGGLAYFYWEAAVDGLRATLESWLIIDSLLRWLGSIGGESFRTVLVPIIIIQLLLSMGSMFRASFGLFFNVPLDRSALIPTTDVIDTFVYRALRQGADYGMSAAVGVYQSVVGFVLVLLSNWAVRRVDPDRALF